MKTEWDYTELADAYLKRADYSDAAIDAMLSIAGVKEGENVCDVGSGVAHLTLMLAARNFNVIAVEPNDAMRANGAKRTKHLKNVQWFEGTGEQTGQGDDQFEIVTFGSSFNVCDRPAALEETARILRPQGLFACMWNHRKLDDPLQSRIEATIKKHLPDYRYGSRREDQTKVIDASSLFGPVLRLNSTTVHQQPIEDCVEAWRSHATLQRQAGSSFHAIVNEIESKLNELESDCIDVPYDTHLWIARLK